MIELLTVLGSFLAFGFGLGLTLSILFRKRVFAYIVLRALFGLRRNVFWGNPVRLFFLVVLGVFAFQSAHYLLTAGDRWIEGLAFTSIGIVGAGLLDEILYSSLEEKIRVGQVDPYYRSQRLPESDLEELPPLTQTAELEDEPEQE